MTKFKDRSIDILPKAFLYVLIGLGLLGIVFTTLRVGFIAGAAFSLLPLVLYVILYTVKFPYWAYTLVFIVNYFIMGLTRYLPGLPGGVVIDTLIFYSVIVLLIRTGFKKVGWERARTGLSLAALIWLLYCGMELFNPMGSPLAWATTIRGEAVYFFCVAVLTPIFFYRYRDLKRILFLWSVFTLAAVLKAMMQKYYGFDTFEKIWLYEGGGMTTHIIYSGVRYFSIYTDAGNFGSAMGLAMVVFSICAIYYKDPRMKLYYLFIAAAAAYGMVISGTRGALAVPFAGYTLYLILSRRKTITVLGATALLAAFLLLNYTTIGNSNSYIRRMRSAFNTEDASLNVRLQNQRKIAAYMKDKPFGTGIGMGGGKAKEYAPNAYLSQIPTDSWFVMIWTETGIVGLLLHLAILFYIIGQGCYLVLFKLRDPQLRGLIGGLTAGIFGIMVSSYGNEILGQFPTGIIIYTCQAFIFLSVRYDKEIMENRQHELHEYDDAA